MSSSQNSSVAYLAPEPANLSKEISLVYLVEHFLAKVSCYGFHLYRNRNIVSSQISVAALGICNAQADAGSSEVADMLVNNRLSWISKINKDKTAYRGNHLVHQTAVLAKILVLSELAHLGNIHRTYSTLVVMNIQNCANQHLKGCGRRKTTAT